MNEKYIGIDIGGTTAKIGIVDADGQILQKETVSVNFDNYETPILTTVMKETERFLIESCEDQRTIAGIGVSATGEVDTGKGVIAGSAGHIKNWKGSKIKESLETELKIPAYVMNDANAAALGEQWLGAAKGKNNVVVVTVGTGIGGGIIVNSEILLGTSGFAGEIGHFPIQCEGEYCSCGNRGCIEHYGSTQALVRMVEKAVRNGDIPELEGQKIDGKLIFQLAERQNKHILEILDCWMDYLAAFLVGMVHIFNPEMILIGGGVSAQGKLFIEPLEKKVKSGVMSDFARDFTLEAAKLGNDAGMIGAVAYCIREQKKHLCI